MARRSYGTGSLFARADATGREAWYGSFYVDGRRVKRKIGPKRAEGARDGLTRAQAEKRLRELMQTAVPTQSASRLSIAEVGRLLVVDLERKNRKAETIRNVRVAIDVHAAPFFGDRAIGTITREDVERLALHMSRQGARSRRRGLAPKSIRNYLGALSQLFTFAIRKGYATTNPVSLVDLPQLDDSKEIRFLSPDDVRLLVAGIPDGAYAQTDRTLFLVAAMTGLRLGELRALRWCDVDWSAACVRVRRNYVKGRFGTPKTRRGSRSVPMADEVAGALDRHHQAASARGRAPRDTALVFPDPITGDPLDDNAIRDRFAAALDAVGLPKRTPHDLRHTFGTTMAAAGVPMRTLQEWMGHRDIATTQIYADYAPSHREAEMVAAAFGRGSIRGSNLTEPTVSQEQPTSASIGNRTQGHS